MFPLAAQRAHDHTGEPDALSRRIEIAEIASPPIGADAHDRGGPDLPDVRPSIPEGTVRGGGVPTATER